MSLNNFTYIVNLNLIANINRSLFENFIKEKLVYCQISNKFYICFSESENLFNFMTYALCELFAFKSINLLQFSTYFTFAWDLAAFITKLGFDISCFSACLFKISFSLFVSTIEFLFPQWIKQFWFRVSPHITLR